MAATKAVSLQIAPKTASDSSENAFNLEVSDESSCNSDVDILDLICETTRDPENSFCDKDILGNDECKENYPVVPVTSYGLSFDVSNYDSKTDLKSKVATMTPAVTFDVCSQKRSIASKNESSNITDFGIDDLLSTLSFIEPKTFIKSEKDCIDSTLFDFLEETESKCELIEECDNEVKIGSPQLKSSEGFCEHVSSLSLAALAECHFRDNFLGDSVLDSSRVLPNKVTTNSYFSSAEDCKSDLKEPVSCNEDLGISLSALAESYLSSETKSNCISSQIQSKKSVSKVDDLDILSFIDSVNIEVNCSGGILDFSAKESESSVLSESVEVDKDVDEGYDSGKLSPGIDLNECIKKPSSPVQYFKKSIANDDSNIFLPQDEGINIGFVNIFIHNPKKENALNLIPKPPVLNTKQSLFAKVLTCKSNKQNETAGEKVSNIKKDLFEKYFCTSKKNILHMVQDSKKVMDKSKESIIAAGYFHFPSNSFEKL